MQLEMSLADVAALARVQRPVPSMWRRRSIGSTDPFPPAVGWMNGEERFAADDVASWLQRTGRGNHDDVRGDVAAFAVPAGVGLRGDAVAFIGLTALLCLKAVTDADLSVLTRAELLGMASEADPGDSLLLGEIAALGADAQTWAEYADLLVEAAYGPSAAMERLLDQRSRLAQRDLAATAVSGDLRRLVDALLTSLARECGSDPAVYVDAGCGAGDLLLPVLAAGGGANVEFLQVATGPHSRLLRRRALVAGVPAAWTDTWPAGTPLVALAHYGTARITGEGVHALLDAIDVLALSLDDAQRAVVVGPASVLLEGLTGTGQQLRSQVLRSGRVRALLLLPPGLVTARVRERVGIWVLGPGESAQHVGERRVAVLDLADLALSTLTVGQVCDDVLAAVAPPSLARAHSYVHARWQTAANLLSRSGSLVPPRVRAQRAAAADPALGRLMQLPYGLELLGDLVPTAATVPGHASWSIGEAVTSGAVRIVPGNRGPFPLDTHGGLVVIGVEELFEPAKVGTRRVDRLAFLGSGQAARLTEPGDVVFCTSPRPLAMVDVDGGSAVEFPARVLRVLQEAGAGLVPHLIARQIRGQPTRSRRWQSWPVPRLAAVQAPLAARALSRLTQERHALAARLAELDDFDRVLAHGLSTGDLVFTPHPHSTKDS